MLTNEEASALRQILPYDFYAFIQEAWHVIEPSVPFETNFHIKHIADKMQQVVERIARREPRDKDMMFNVPPGSTKTTILIVMLPVWAWLVMPSMRIITASFELDRAITPATKSRDIIQSEWFVQLFGDRLWLRRDFNKKTEYVNNHSGRRFVTSVTSGNVTSVHGDLFLIDDPLNPKLAASKLKLAECIRWYKLTVSTRLTNQKIATKGIIMQRLDEDDLCGYLLKNFPDMFDLTCLPATTTDYISPPELASKYTDGLLDPSRLSHEVIAKMEVLLGSMGYAGQYMQSPAAEGGNIIKEEYFRRFRMADLERIKETTGVTPVWDFVLDGAFTEKQINDPSGIFAYTNYANNTYIRAVQSVFLEIPELLQFINDFCIRNGNTIQSRVYIEPKASGHSAEQMLRKYSKLNVQLDKSPTKDKVARAKGILPYMESGRCYLLEDAPWSDEFMGQVTLFPNAKHDEYVDLLSMAIDKVERPQGSTILNIESF